MPKVHITEHASHGRNDRGAIMAAELPALAVQTIDTAGTTLSAALNGGTRLVRLLADADCRVLVGYGTPAAGSADMPLRAGTPEYFAVPEVKTATGALKISVATY